MSEKCPIIAIDPGNRQSAYCVIDCNTLKPLEFGKVDNEELRNKLVFANEQGWQWAVIEMVASYGMAVGREVFDTVLWIGRFYEALSIQMAQKPRLLRHLDGQCFIETPNPEDGIKNFPAHGHAVGSHHFNDRPLPSLFIGKNQFVAQFFVIDLAELQRLQGVAVNNAVGTLPVARINGNNRAFFTHKYDLPNS